MIGMTRARRKAERPNEILEAAFEEFSRSGFAATRMEDVAARAGVTKGTIYFYFPCKKELFIALVRQMALPLLTDVEQFRVDDAGTTLDFLRRHIRLVYKTLIEDPRGRKVFGLLISESQRFPELMNQFYDHEVDHLKRRTIEIIRLGIERGEIRPCAGLDYPEIVIAPAIYLQVLMIGDGLRFDIERFFEAHVDLMLHGLLPHEPSGSSKAKAACSGPLKTAATSVSS